MKIKTSRTACRAPISEKIANLSVLIITVLMLSGILYCYATDDRFEFYAGIATLILFLYVQLILGRPRSLNWPFWLRIVFSLLVLSSAFFGRFFALYQSIQGFDKSQHFLYGGVLALAAMTLFYRLQPEQSRRLSVRPGYVAFSVVSISLFFSVIWEVFEFSSDRLIGSNMQSWQDGPESGLIDTMLDLIFALGGAAIVGVWIYYHLKKDAAGFYKRFFNGSGVEHAEH